MSKAETVSGQDIENPSYDPEVHVAGSSLHFPFLGPSRHPEIGDSLPVIDKNGRALLSLFYKKAFTSYLDKNHEYFTLLIELVKETCHSVQFLIDHGDQAKAPAFIQIKKKFYQEIRKKTELFLSQLDSRSMETGIQWYSYRLQKDLSSFPKSLTIRYDKKEFDVQNSDSPSLRWLKTRHRFFSMFSNGYIYASIAYREILGYYLRDNRHHFLSSWLREFRNSSQQNAAFVLNFMNVCDDHFDKVYQKITTDSFSPTQWQHSCNEMIELLQDHIEEEKKLFQLFEDRLLVEFRKNILRLQKNLEQIDVTRMIRLRRKEAKYYAGLREKNSSFAASWHKAMILEGQKIQLDASLRTFKWQVKHELELFRTDLNAVWRDSVLIPLQRANQLLHDNGKDGEKILGLEKLEWVLPREVLKKDYKQLSEKLLQATKSVPEKVSISLSPGTNAAPAKDQPSELSIPARKIAQHFLEKSFLGPLYEVLQDYLEKIKGSVYNINDQLSMALFNLENVHGQDMQKTSAIQEITHNAYHEMLREEDLIKGLKREVDEKITSLKLTLFKYLSATEAENTTQEYNQLARDYKSRKALSWFSKWVDTIGDFVIRHFLVLIYSRSEGIRVAQQINRQKSSQSVTEQTLELVEKVTPRADVISKLPHHYLNLFSGRSSIGESFWITQETEERQFVQAVNRYNKGYHGGIMILGERNSGKTALCRRMVDKHFKEQKVVHLFSGEDGGYKTDDFIRGLGSAVGVSGDLAGIANVLPHRSVIVLHDLELWWQRTSNGLDIVKLVMDAITAYSERFIFIVNMNPFAYELINMLVPLHEKFIAAIRCLPFSSLELKNLIITRHRSSGLLLDDGKKSLSEVKLAGFFNYYFDYSGGNPGVAMSAWLNSIQKVSGKTITIKPPETPNIEVLYRLPDEWNLLLIQLILHKRLSFEKFKRLFENDFPVLADTLNALIRSGLVQERTIELYIINPHIEPFIQKAFRQKGWL